MNAHNLHVICVAYQRAIPLRILIDSFKVQTNPCWILYIIHDGPAPEDVKEVVSLYKNDPRIFFSETPTRLGKYGHPNRDAMLKRLALNHRDFVLITNDDNYYVPVFVEMMMKYGHSPANPVGMVYCDTVHSYFQYNVLQSQVKKDHIDMGSFIVRVDIAKKIGFKSMELNGDGAYAEECANFCTRIRLKINYIQKPLFVHN
jgi:hypothetical protein